MKPTRGFTLVELLLVISIVALLSSILMTSFATGRGRAKDAAVKRQLTEMRSLMAREFSDVGNYSNLKANGAAKTPGTTCSVGAGATQLKGTYATNFKNACDSLIRIPGASCRFDGAASGTCLEFNRPLVASDPNHQKFSLVAFLPEESRVQGQNMFLCMGSNGRTSISNSSLNGAGCPNDPQL